MAVIQPQLSAYLRNHSEREGFDAYTEAKWKQYQSLESAVRLIGELRETLHSPDDQPTYPLPHTYIPPRVSEVDKQLYKYINEWQSTLPHRDSVDRTQLEIEEEELFYHEEKQTFLCEVFTLVIEIGSITIEITPGYNHQDTILVDDEEVWHGSAFDDHPPIKRHLRELPLDWLLDRLGPPDLMNSKNGT